MKMRHKIVMFALGASILASGAAFAGGCLQGTWHYYNASGKLVGEETVGCGTLDGAWGASSANRTFSQGCGGTSAM